MAVRNVAISKIQTSSCQGRTGINPETVADYTQALKEGAQFPPVELFHQGGDYWLSDGAHRIEAHRANGMRKIKAKVKPGSYRDALARSFVANEAHGLRRRRVDKRHSIVIALGDPQWAKLSNRRLADICGVSHELVRLVRSNAPTKSTLPAVAAQIVEVGDRKPKRRTRKNPSVYRVGVNFTPEQMRAISRAAAEKGQRAEKYIADVVLYVCGFLDEEVV